MIMLATDTGVVLAEREDDGWVAGEVCLANVEATSIVAREGVVLVGTRNGVHRSDDSGQSWRETSTGLSSRLVRWMANHPDISDLEFVGAEPGGIFVSTDGAESWRECPEINPLREAGEWFLPYSPGAGCVRGFAFNGQRGYAAVEVGGVLRSDDAGTTWRLAGGSDGRAVFDIPPRGAVHADVHSVAGHRSDPDLALAATAEGLYISRDGGDTWTVTQGGNYCRAVWVDPADADHILASPADSVSSMNGRIEESFDAGATWTRRSDGLGLPWPHTMVERFIEIGEDLFAITNDGQAYTGSASGGSWRRILADVPGIQAVAQGPND